MTVEEFRQLPDDRGPFYHELRHGELVAVPRPKLKHSIMQSKLRRLFERLAPPGSYVDSEMAFRPLPEHELWCADVAYLTAERFRQADLDDYIRGAPDLVIEVLSPSNSAAEILDKEQLCLANGASEFWVIHPDRCYIKISTSAGTTRTYHEADEIPLPLFGNAKLPVRDIFAR